jgi:hypothetical protein
MTAAILDFNLALASGAAASDRAAGKLVFLLPQGSQRLECPWRRDTHDRLVCDWHQSSAAWSDGS